MDDIELIVFRDGAVTGSHPGVAAAGQGFAYVIVSVPEVRGCVGVSLAADYGVLETGEPSYLVTATLRCLGLGVRPGAAVAYLRLSDDGSQAGAIYHQNDIQRNHGASATPSDDAGGTTVVTGWAGEGWAGEANVLDGPGGVEVTDRPVNAALRELGAKRGGHPDEAAALGLPLPPR